MENINLNVADITYKSELTPHSACFKHLLRFGKLSEGLIRPNNLRSLSFRKLWAH
jgi:hypothetical protein